MFVPPFFFDILLFYHIPQKQFKPFEKSPVSVYGTLKSPETGLSYQGSQLLAVCPLYLSSITAMHRNAAANASCIPTPFKISVFISLVQHSM